MEQKSIADAIAAFTEFVRRSTDGRIRDRVPGSHAPNDTGLAAWKLEVESICDQMNAMANDASLDFADFEVLRHKLLDFPPTPPDLLQAVADAFAAAGRL